MKVKVTISFPGGDDREGENHAFLAALNSPANHFVLVDDVKMYFDESPKWEQCDPGVFVTESDLGEKARYVLDNVIPKIRGMFGDFEVVLVFG